MAENENMLSPFEFIQHCTAKIFCEMSDGTTGTGTSFFFKYQLGSNGFDVIVTNKHVIEDSETGARATKGRFKITMKDDNGVPNLQDIKTISIGNFYDGWIMHPDPHIDLCIFPMAHFYSKLPQNLGGVAAGFIREEYLPKNLNLYKPTEDIYMVGYPDGLGDDKHNLPLVRRGITATPFYIEHNGHPEFLVDCACFPGSSGSPILIVNEGSYTLPRQTPRIGNRIIFLGILYAGPEYEAEGELIKYKISDYTAVTDMPLNLGYCINSTKLLDFKPILEKMLNNQNS